ncbi:hypothetical protein ACVWWN_005781 [Mycobacterium sp. URHB0021]|jgi:hypothetical protein
MGTLVAARVRTSSPGESARAGNPFAGAPADAIGLTILGLPTVAFMIGSDVS